jgi:hypothetical protein
MRSKSLILMDDSKHITSFLNFLPRNIFLSVYNFDS